MERFWLYLLMRAAQVEPAGPPPMMAMFFGVGIEGVV